MVQRAPADNSKYRVKQSDLSQDCRLGLQIEYFDCPVCLEMKAEILECKCTSRSCRECLKTFSNGMSQADFERNRYKCMICHDQVQMQRPNKILAFLLQKVIRFDCQDCQRHYSYSEFDDHKKFKRCQPDPTAHNTIDKLKQQLVRRGTLMPQKTNQNGASGSLT